MRVIIAGSRDITDPGELDRAIEDSGFIITTVICGCAKGVDRLGETWGLRYNVPVEYYPADWDTHGRRAGPIRNRQMAEAAGPGGGLIAVMRAKGTPGTKDMIRQAEAFKLKVHVRLVR